MRITFLLHGLDQLFLKVEKVDLRYLSGRDFIRNNIDRILSNDNILSARFVKFLDSAGILILALNQ